jgi:hypothetical protein
MSIIKQKQETPDQRPGPGDYFVVQSEYSTWYVSAATAEAVGRALGRRWLGPRWLRFVDLNGSRAWLRADPQSCSATATASSATCAARRSAPTAAGTTRSSERESRRSAPVR